MTFPETPKAGVLLVAEPFMGDPSFDRSVILIAEHNENGTVGYILNRPLEIKLDSLIPDFPESKSILHNGGPVQQNNLYFLHQRIDLFPNAIQVAKGLYWGGDFDRLKEVVRLGLVQSDEIRFYLGYTGWSSGQLEGELMENCWRIIPSNTMDLYNTPPEAMWRQLIELLGGDYLLWANAPVDPLLN